MPYREDREADVARADALQVDIDRAERELAAARRKLAETERNRDALAAELARRPGVAPSPTPVPPSPPTASAAGVIVAVVVVLLIAFAAFLHSRERREAAAREADSARQILETQLAAGPCTLQTIPDGASVYGTIGGQEILLGKTPMVLSMPPIADAPSIVVRVDGFAPHEISLWDGCPPTLRLAR